MPQGADVNISDEPRNAAAPYGEIPKPATTTFPGAVQLSKAATDPLRPIAVSATEKGQANGVATLDADGHIPSAQVVGSGSVAQDGVDVAARPKLNVSGGVAAVDNPAQNRIDLTVLEERLWAHDPRWAGGAKGDGVTDSSAALAAAFGAGGQHAALHFPDGDFKFSAGTLGGAASGQGRSIELVGAGARRTTLRPADNVSALATFQGSGDTADDHLVFRDFSLASASSRAPDKPILDILDYRGVQFHNVRCDVSSLNAGTIARLRSAYLGGFYGKCHWRTGKYVTPIEIINDAPLSFDPGHAPQIDTFSFAGLVVIGCIGPVLRNGGASGVTGNEMHGFDFTGYKQVSTSYYPVFTNAPSFETTLSADAAAGDTSIVVSSVGAATAPLAQNGISVGDVLVAGYGDTVDFCQVTAKAGTTLTLHALGPLRWAHAAGTPVFVGGCCISLGQGINLVTLGPSCHFEGPLVGVLVGGTVRCLTILGALNGVGEHVRVMGDLIKLRCYSIHTYGNGARHKLINRPANSPSTNDGDWIYRGVSVDNAAPVPLAQPYVSHNSRNWVSEGTSSGQISETANTNAGNESAKRFVGATSNNVETYSISYGGQGYFSDGAVTKDLGAIDAKTSAQIDALFKTAPRDGTVATGTLGGSPVALARRGGKWNVTAALTVIA